MTTLHSLYVLDPNSLQAHSLEEGGWGGGGKKKKVGRGKGREGGGARRWVNLV